MSFTEQLTYTREKGPNRNPFTKYLPKEYEVREIIIDNQIIQKQWAIENDYRLKNPKQWMFEILKAQILSYKPDIIYASTISTFPNYLVEEIKEELEHPCLWVSYYGLKSENLKKDFQHFDLVLTGWIPCLEELRDMQIPCAFFPQYVDDQFAKEALRINEKDLLFSFIGNIAQGGEEFNERRDYIKLLIEKCGLEIWSPLLKENCSQKEYYRLKFHSFFYDLSNYIKNSNYSAVLPYLWRLNQYAKWTKRPDPSVFIHPVIIRKCNAPVYGFKMYELFRRSKLIFNSYIRMDLRNGKIPYVAGNIRLFEATGVGSCILTKYTDDLSNLFVPDEEVAVYRSKEEAVSKAKYLLNNESELNRIAKAGMRKTWRKHTAEIRAKEFIHIIRDKLVAI